MEDKKTISRDRKIIDDFATEIKKRIDTDTKPSKEVIYFRNEHKKPKERDVVEVPVELLRFRKDNGRIASDVISYEKSKGPIKEESVEDQEILKEMLKKKDQEKTKELINSIKHSGQREPAIITVDGFLINGNRRKLALEELWDKTKEVQYMLMPELFYHPFL